MSSIEEASILYKRRSDDHQNKIDELIEAEQDHKTRLTLMIMSNLNKSIIANTELIQSMQGEMVALKQEVQTQVAEQEAAKHQGMGMYKVMKVVTPALWFITCAIVSIMYQSYAEFQDKTTSTLSNVETHLHKMETVLILRGITETPVEK